MDLGSRRKSTSSRNGVMAGSVWENRMKLDEVKGGFKVYSNSEEENDDKNCTFTNGENVDNNQVDKKLGMGPKPNLGVGVSGKRKTWKAERVEGNPIQIAGKRSDLSKKLDEKCKESSEKVPIQSKKTKSQEAGKELSVSVEGIDKSNFRRKETGSESLNGNVKAKSATSNEEKFITSNVVEKYLVIEDGEKEEEWDEVLEEEIVDVKEIRILEQKPKQVVVEEKKHHHSNNRAVPIASINKKHLPNTFGHDRIHPSPIPTRTKSVPVSDECQPFPRQHSKLQSLVDLVMWRHIPKSALVFGIGTFIIISSSYTQDLNLSFISVLSFLGLVYLAAIFLYRSLIHRGTIDIGESSEYVVGEEEAVWVLKLILPFVNEFLLKIRILFAGDPATTMKMAVLLFLLARYGSSITIWKLFKLGFLGVFVVPKVCSSYSTQLTSHGTFWLGYIRDAWESCSHKKAAGFAIFTLVWNFSSIIARIWAVFMLYVGFRYDYQQTLMREGKADDSLQGKIQRQKSSQLETRKQKKPS